MGFYIRIVDTHIMEEWQDMMRKNKRQQMTRTITLEDDKIEYLYIY